MSRNPRPVAQAISFQSLLQNELGMSLIERMQIAEDLGRQEAQRILREREGRESKENKENIDPQR